ncbi:MAG: phosphoenolpyruvate-utilizing protein [Actinomycetia bacterium]|nr:phosphoenolpyruvate-utilizing protein [Actinomycetes bacterium]
MLPEPPSPLGWDLVFEGGTILGWRDCMTNRLGIEDHEVDPVRPEVMGVFGGFAYLGATMLRVWAERTPGFSAELLDAAYFAGHPDVPPYAAEDWHQNEHTTEVMTGWLGWVMGDMNQDELEADRVEAHALRDGRPDLSKLTDRQLLDRATSLKSVCRRMFDQHINQSGAAGIAPGVIASVCEAIGRPEAAMHLMAGMGGVDSAAPSYAMWDMSRAVRSHPDVAAMFDEGFDGLSERFRNCGQSAPIAFVSRVDDFVAEYGSRGPNEWDIHSPSWETDPDLVLALIDSMRHSEDDASPAAENSRREAERMKLGSEILEALAADAETQGRFAAALRSTEVFLPGRERSKTNIIRVIGEVRVAVWEIGRRAVERGELSSPRDICLLFGDELEALVDGTLEDIGEIVEGRRAHLEFLGTREPPFVFSSPPPPSSDWPEVGGDTVEHADVGDQLSGLPGCPGTARGRAVVIDHPSDPGDLGPGDIMIAPMTDPAWTPLFVPAAAVVVNVGAPLSHAIIVSRELGIPCVVSVTGATDKIPNGATVEVDGDSGTVTIIDLG